MQPENLAVPCLVQGVSTLVIQFNKFRSSDLSTITRFIP
jgi:hypothetical protein